MSKNDRWEALDNEGTFVKHTKASRSATGRQRRGPVMPFDAFMHQQSSEKRRPLLAIATVEQSLK